MSYFASVPTAVWGIDTSGKNQIPLMGDLDRIWPKPLQRVFDLDPFASGGPSIYSLETRNEIGHESFNLSGTNPVEPKN